MIENIFFSGLLQLQSIWWQLVLTLRYFHILASLVWVIKHLLYHNLYIFVTVCFLLIKKKIVTVCFPLVMLNIYSAKEPPCDFPYFTPLLCVCARARARMAWTGPTKLENQFEYLPMITEWNQIFSRLILIGIGQCILRIFLPFSISYAYGCG
jgi:hypothetical protein